MLLIEYDTAVVRFCDHIEWLFQENLILQVSGQVQSSESHRQSGLLRWQHQHDRRDQDDHEASVQAARRPASGSECHRYHHGRDPEH